jgi:hypothetical protein
MAMVQSLTHGTSSVVAQPSVSCRYKGRCRMLALLLVLLLNLP